MRCTASTLSISLLTLAAACTAAPPTVTLSRHGDITRPVGPGLEQRITLTPSEPTTGEDLIIESVIANKGNQPVALQSRICGLDLGGNLDLKWPPGFGACEGHSQGGDLAPGEARESSARRRVASPPGVYTLRVRHALQPESWVEVRVVVRGR
jgi:hypothetical protein